MKRLILTLMMFGSIPAFAQITNRLIFTQNFEQGINSPNLLFTLPPNDNRIFVASRDSLKLNFKQIRNIRDSIISVGMSAFKPIGYVPDWADLTGKPNLGAYITSESDPLWAGVSGNYRTKLQNDALYQTIGSYLTAESDPLWTAASINYRTKTQNDLLYQPVGSYLTSETDPLFNTKFAAKTTTDLTEGGKLFFTNARARSAIILTTTGSGSPTYDSVNGILNIPASGSNYTVNSATIGLSKSTLNSTYPNVPVGYLVLCPSIILGGAVYIKATENGSSDVWQTISAPPTL